MCSSLGAQRKTSISFWESEVKKWYFRVNLTILNFHTAQIVDLVTFTEEILNGKPNFLG